jgi:beta-glucanase (GH16 family)
VQFDDPGLKLKDFLDRNDIVNTSAFTALGQTFAARTLLLEVQEAELGSYAGYAAWRAKYKVTYDPDTHDEKRADIGPFYKAGGQTLRYMDSTNTFPMVGALNGSGAKATDPAELVFRCKKEVEFSTIIRTS